MMKLPFKFMVHTLSLIAILNIAAFSYVYSITAILEIPVSFNFFALFWSIVIGTALTNFLYYIYKILR